MMPLLLIRVDQQTGGPQLVFRGLTVEATEASWNEKTGAGQLVDRDHPIFERAMQTALRKGAASDDAATIGRELWDVVFEGDGELGNWWRSQVGAAGVPVRTILDISVDEMRAVPWEFLAPAGAAPVFRSNESPWVRAVKTPWDFPDMLEVPVKVLVIVGVADSDELDVDPELAAIYGAVRNSPGRWNVEILDRPAEPLAIQTRYREVEPDVVHVIGHGVEVGGKLGLAMEGQKQDDPTWLLTADDINGWPLPPPRLVVLNACRSASQGERDAAWSCVDAFVRRGAAAVIAMQGDIDSASAVAFSGKLYQNLTQGTPLDAAAAEARYAVSSGLKVNGLDDLAWAFPALSVTADPDRVLPVRAPLPGMAPDPLSRPPYSGAVELVAHCVDRAVERRTFWRAIDPANDRAGSLFLVTGDQEIGKSSLVVSSLLTLRLRERNVVYVDMEKHRTELDRRASWLTVLRGVRDALWREQWIPDAPLEHRDRFNHDLSFLMQQKTAPPWSEGSAYTDPGGEYSSVGENFEEWIDNIFDSFFVMLDGAAGGEPLLVVLDSLREIEESDIREHLSPRLIEPAADQRKWPHLRFVVVGRPDELELLGARATSLAGQPLRIKAFKSAEVRRLARENFARAGREMPMNAVTTGVLGGLPDEVPPALFRQVVTVLGSLKQEAGN
ncbi:MAG: putative caspase domain protein [Marmoricola sp.]|nr:putative caspase domain protein [Marmoricola sp.]